MMNNRIKILATVGVIALLVLISLALFLTLKQKSSNEVGVNPPPSNIETSNPQANQVSKAFQGEHLTATIGSNWTIKELTADSEMDELRTNNKYAGLIGLEILFQNQPIFEMHGVDGVGGINFCNTIYKFADTPQSYIDEYNMFADEQNFERPEVIDLSNETYSEFKVFGTSVRRIKDTLYWISIDDNQSTPYCGIANEIIKFTSGPSFSAINSTQANSNYRVSLKDTLGEGPLKELESILKSLKAK